MLVVWWFGALVSECVGIGLGVGGGVDGVEGAAGAIGVEEIAWCGHEGTSICAVMTCDKIIKTIDQQVLGAYSAKGPCGQIVVQGNHMREIFPLYILNKVKCPSGMITTTLEFSHR